MTDYAKRNRELFEVLHASKAEVSVLEVKVARAKVDQRPAIETKLDHARRTATWAREQLILTNQPWAESLATKHVKRRGHLTRADLAQAGVEGIMAAIDRFDPTKGIQFSTYAAHWIENKIYDEIREQTLTYSSGRGIHEAYIASVRRLRAQLDREPTVEEIVEDAAYDSMSADHVIALQRTASPLRLDASVGDPDSADLAELVTSTDDTIDRLIDDADNDVRVASMLAGITETQQTVIAMRHGIGYDTTFGWDDIAKVLAISPNDVRRLEHEAVLTLRATAGVVDTPAPAPAPDHHALDGFEELSDTIPNTTRPKGPIEYPKVGTNDRRGRGPARTVPRSAYAIEVGYVPALLFGKLLDKLVKARGATYGWLESEAGVPAKRQYGWREGEAWVASIDQADAVLRALDAHALWHEEPLASYLRATWAPPAPYKRKRRRGTDLPVIQGGKPTIKPTNVA